MGLYWPNYLWSSRTVASTEGPFLFGGADLVTREFKYLGTRLNNRLT